MPRRKKLPVVPDYIDGGNSDKGLVINKSNPLLSLSQTSLTLPEFKILDAYLGRINSHDPEKRTVRFEKGKLEECLGVSRILKDDLDKRLRNLFQVIEVKDDTKRRGFKLVSLFEEADAEQDDNGLWQVTLTCTPSAREYIFNVDNIGYFKYRLKNVMYLTSRYSYILYLYLEKEHYRGTWEIDLEELKKILNCTAERYNQFKFFNAEILKKCQAELCEKTNRKFTYEPVKKGRKVAKIRFTIEKANEILDDIEPSRITTEQNPDEYDLWAEPLKEFNLKNEQLDELRELLAVVPDFKLPELPGSINSIDLRRYHYMALKAAEIKRRDSERPIRSKFGYLKKMIQKDIKEE